MSAPSLDQWILGLDLQPSGNGALEFAYWLCRADKREPTLQIKARHVMEEQYLQAMLRHHHLDELRGWANEAMLEDLEQTGAKGTITDVEIMQGGVVSTALMKEATDDAPIIVARHADQEGLHAVRLGRVARRILRSSSNPTVVVPPDLTAAAIGTGPIVVATDLRDDSIDAVQFAIALGARLGREVLLVSVVATPNRYAARFLPTESLDAMHLAHEKEGEQALAKWALANAFDALETRVVAGSVVPQLLEVVGDMNACMLVLGSRRLSGLERLLISSVGGALAASSPCAVAVVPPPRYDE